MDALQTVLIALLQGFTEFLPISSSGHLALLPAFTGWDDQGLGFDIAVHAGSLLAVIAYFRGELLAMGRTVLLGQSAEARLGRQIVIATIPLGLAGLVFADVVESELRSPAVIAIAGAVFGVLLWLADRLGRGARTEAGLGLTDVLLIGCGQALSLIPGTSRSGITMTVALARGLSREAAGRFSFLLSVPAIAMVALWQSIRFATDPAPVAWGSLAAATAISAATAFASIALFLKMIGRIGMGVFAVYRVALGVLIWVVLL